MVKFISHSGHETVKEYMLNIVYKDDQGCGYAFDCDSAGKLTGSSAALDNHKKAVARCEGPDPDMVNNGISVRVYRNFVPAVIECSRCKQEHYLGHGRYSDTQCECGQNYNAFGQELRDDYNDASTYAETGEDYWGDND